MSDLPLRAAVVGPGAIGATIAACLQQARVAPVLCGRTPLEQIVVTPDDGEPTTLASPVVTDPATLDGPIDHVLLAVKAHQTRAAAPWLDRLASERTVVTVLQNGIEQRELVEPLAHGAEVVPSVVWFPAEVLAPGDVRLRDTPQISVPDTAGGRAVAELLASSPCEVDVAADYDVRTWRKLCQNAVAGLMVLTRRRAGAFREEQLAGLARAYVEECVAVARAEGVALPDGLGEEIVGWMASAPPDLGSSILFDAEAGRPLEWDARNAVLLRRARRHGLPTPIGDVIVPLLAAASA